jgi:hypothetical protein
MCSHCRNPPPPRPRSATNLNVQLKLAGGRLYENGFYHLQVTLEMFWRSEFSSVDHTEKSHDHSGKWN